MSKTTISLKDLRSSQPIGHDINRPKTLWQVIDDIHAVLGENKIEYFQDEIHIEISSAFHVDKQMTADAFNPELESFKPLSEWIFDELYTRIIIVDDLHEMEGTILVAYNKYGIQVAFGLSYHERAGVALLGEDDTLMSTSACGDIKVLPYFAMVHRVKQWFPLSNRNVLDQLERSKNVMNKSLNLSAMNKFIEHYTGKYNDCIEDNKLVGPVSFGMFIEALRESIEKQFSRTKNYSAWDLYNAGNEILVPGGILRLKELLPLGYFWGAYVFSRLT